jgi:hypothetical protein
MIDSPTHANIADFKQRYQGVFGWINPEENRSLVYVSNVNTKQVTFKDANGNEFYANVGANVDFEFLPVNRAWYKTNKGMFFGQRIPARQWKRGVCTENTQLREVVGVALATTVMTMRWHDAVFSVMQNPTNYKKQVDHYLASATEVNTPLSKHFAIVHTSLYFFSKVVGTVDKINLVITLTSDMVYQELIDVCRRNNYPFKVNINA